MPRDRPVAALLWAAVYFLWRVGGGSLCVTIVVAPPQKAQFGRVRVARSLLLVVTLAPLALLCTMFDAMMSAAMNRVVFRSAPDRFA